MTEASSTPNLGTPDESYYWDSAVFLVEGCLFKVPKYHIVKGSSYFTKTFGLLPNQTDVVDEFLVLDKASHSGGESSHLTQCPIALGGISAADFRNLLGVLYPKTIQIKLTLTKMQWISVLKVSTLWYFKGIRKLAIEQLDSFNLGPVERVCLGKQYNVSMWLLNGYDELVKRGAIIAMDDAKKIGLESAVQLYICRQEQLHAIDADYLDKAFAKELAVMSEREQEHLTEEDIASLEEAKKTREQVRQQAEMDRVAYELEQARLVEQAELERVRKERERQLAMEKQRACEEERRRRASPKF
ncbi:hypothetical protein FA15DRAFT_654439 [Coprinopsis marcescibilis]|uniref:BTB domain-containing protein n=1 Tax=Coprinopsis marcescibilis TaxID=230819 RepID=A0A5C3L158_COPMA|nr:hypothetical protein FA15DRAFT_654439 [Coprinopsis marcescibilis]